MKNPFVHASFEVMGTEILVDQDLLQVGRPLGPRALRVYRPHRPGGQEQGRAGTEETRLISEDPHHGPRMSPASGSHHSPAGLRHLA